MLKEKTVAHKQAERRIKELEGKLDRMQREMERHQKEQEEAEGNRNRLARLYDMELIDSDGNPKDND